MAAAAGPSDHGKYGGNYFRAALLHGYYGAAATTAGDYYNYCGNYRGLPLLPTTSTTALGQQVAALQAEP